MDDFDEQAIDLFAAAALIGFVVEGLPAVPPSAQQDMDLSVADRCYDLARAMMVIRDRHRKEQQ